jgi:hypothetical protein
MNVHSKLHSLCCACQSINNEAVEVQLDTVMSSRIYIFYPALIVAGTEEESGVSIPNFAPEIILRFN